MRTYYRDNEIPKRGQRVIIPVHYDLWARGATTGTVRSFHRAEPGTSAYVKVKMDHAGVKRQLKVWRLDWPYMVKLDAKSAECTYPTCKCVVSTSTTSPVPTCPMTGEPANQTRKA